MFFQTDHELQFDAKEDCFFFDILKIHELVGKHEFSREQVKKLRKVSVRTDFMGEDGYLNAKGISGIATVASGLTGHNVYMRRVDSNSNYNFIISRFSRITNNNKRVSHFVLMDINNPKEVLYDPWSKNGSRTAREGNITEYRYIWSERV